MVDVRSRVTGYVDRWLFQPGAEVAAGQVLYVLDLRPFQASVEQARGNLRQSEADLDFARKQVSLLQAQASLASAQATLVKAQQDHERLKPLVAADAASQQDLDAAVAALRAAEETVKANKANVEQTALSTRTQIASTEGRAGLRVRNLLVGLEVGLSAALLVTAALLTASFVRLMAVDRGFQVDRVLAMNLSLLSTKYPKPAAQAAVFQRVLEKAARLPGVRQASMVSALPLMGETWIDIVGTEHDTRPLVELPSTNVRFISPGYFQTLAVGLRDGRDFQEQDRSRQVAIVSASLAKRLWGAQNPVGRKMMHHDEPTEVVGVTPDFRSTSLDKDPVNMLYIPYWQRPRLSASLLVRTSMDPRGIANALRAAVWEIDAEVTIPAVRTLDEVLSRSVAQRRFQMLLVALFALAALALAAFGAYGVLSYAVTRRTGEMGIRMALGAQRGDVLAMVLRQGMLPVLAGVAAGSLAAAAIGRYLESLLFQVSPRDPVAFAVSGAVLLVVSVAACLIPARRATRVSPIEALRFE